MYCIVLNGKFYKTRTNGGNQRFTKSDMSFLGKKRLVIIALYMNQFYKQIFAALIKRRAKRQTKQQSLSAGNCLAGNRPAVREVTPAKTAIGT
jgi:hypothetical protein